MLRMIRQSVLLLAISVILCCVLYPLALWAVGQLLFPDKSNGSLVRGQGGQVVGSRLIAQPFTRDEYFRPRPSAAGYDATASASSSLASSNYALRDRVARALGPLVRHARGENAGSRVAPDVEAWFRRDLFEGRPHIVAQWAGLHPALAQAWVAADPAHAAHVEKWAADNPSLVERVREANPSVAALQPADLAVAFFEDFSARNPGRFPLAGPPEISSIFFDLWRQEHSDADLEEVPGDLVTASASGLDPHITLANAMFQLERVAAKWAADGRGSPAVIRHEIERVLLENARAPLDGLGGELYVNVLEVNLRLRERFGPPGDL